MILLVVSNVNMLPVTFYLPLKKWGLQRSSR